MGSLCTMNAPLDTYRLDGLGFSLAGAPAWCCTSASEGQSTTMCEYDDGSD